MTKTPIDVLAHRPTWADIDLDALSSNFRVVRDRVGSAISIVAVVKADAYGHGSVECARRLSTEGADWFAVAMPEEGVQLREAGVTQPVLCMGGFWKGQEQLCIRHNIVPVVYGIEMAEALNRAAADLNLVVDAHVKVDTGMGRLGIRFDEAAGFARRLKELRHLRIDGIMTHLAAADDPDRDCFTEQQIQRYKDVAELFRATGHKFRFQDLANSAGTFGHPNALGNMVRPGGVLYGLWRDILPPLSEPLHLRPVMSLRSCISLLKRVHPGETLGYGCTFEASRETLVATLPVGYADGYVRGLSNRGRAIVRGRYASVVGRVSMDLTLLDVTDVPGVQLGDRVTLLGHDGGLSVSAEEIAKTTNTLSYEITCGVSYRVRRLYSGNVMGA